MKRNWLAVRTQERIAQNMPKHYEDKILEFHRFMINTKNNTNYELCQFGNVDEMPITFDVPSNRCVDGKGEKKLTVKWTGPPCLKG